MDIGSQLQSISNMLSDRQLRSFGCECCQRVRQVFDDPIVGELIAFGQLRSAREATDAEIKHLCDRSTAIYDSIFPDDGVPNAIVCALAAAGEVAFTESSLTAAIKAAEFAAAAIARSFAEKAPDGKYDSTFNQHYSKEEHHQKSILQKYMSARIPDRND